MSDRRWRDRVLGPALAAGLLALAGAPPVEAEPPAVVRAAEGPACDETGTDGKRTVTGDNTASALLEVPDATTVAAQRGRKPGAGVTVVVVDAPFADLDPRGFEPLETGHGVIAAGIVGAPAQQVPTRVAAGIATSARLVGRPFYRAPRGSEKGKVVPTSEGLATVLDSVADEVRRGDHGKRVVVLVPMEVPSSSALTAALKRVHASGALVVAAAGDRPQGEGFLDDYAGAPKPGEDAAADVWPSADPRVLTAGVSAPNPYESVLRNSGVDLAAPGTGSVSTDLNGGWCVVETVSSHWAAAQVAGVAALVWSVYDGDGAAELRARLEGTASGNGDQASPLTGYGVVQARAALQRSAEGMTQDARDDEGVPRGEVPKARADLLAGPRHDAVWWGLAGGGAVVVLLVLRPVLSRRPRPHGRPRL